MCYDHYDDHLACEDAAEELRDEIERLRAAIRALADGVDIGEGCTLQYYLRWTETNDKHIRTLDEVLEGGR